MNSEGRKADLLSGLALVVAGVALAWLIYQRHLFASNVVLVAIQVGAALLMIWARVTFGRRSFHATASTTQGGLVTSGPYRYVRHPIYASILYFAWAGQVQAPTVASLAAVAVLTLALGMRMVLEERALMAAYPEYGAYSKQVKRVIPFIV